MIICVSSLVAFLVGYRFGNKPTYDQLEIDSLKAYNSDLKAISDSLLLDLKDYKDSLKTVKEKPNKTVKDTVYIIQIQDKIINKQDSVIRNFQEIKKIDSEIIQGQAEIINKQDGIIKKQNLELKIHKNKNKIFVITSIIEAGIITGLILWPKK